MTNTRRNFLQASAAVAAGLAAGVTGTASSSRAQAPAKPAGRGGGDPQQGPAASVPDSEIRVPKANWGKVEVSRLIVGCNPLYGYSHLNNALSALMKEWYTAAKVCEILHRCERYGVNTFQYLQRDRTQADYEQFQAEGGKMHLIVQHADDPEPLIKAIKPMAVYHQGERTDTAFQNGQMDMVREYCKKLRQLGVMVGVGTHIPEVIALVEEQGWDVDFYAGCVYNRRRTPDQLRKLLGGELPVQANEVYLQDDPPRMYKVMRQTKKPCMPFKILAAGRMGRAQEIEAAFKTAFESIKQTDCVCVGMFPRIKDEVKENAYFVSRFGLVTS